MKWPEAEGASGQFPKGNIAAEDSRTELSFSFSGFLGNGQEVGERLVLAERRGGPVDDDRVLARIERLEHHEEAVQDGRLRLTRDARIQGLLQAQVARQVKQVV